jgi:hypothetical protein
MLPSFSRIALAGILANAPFIAFFLISANVKMAVGMLAGYGLSLTIFGLLHAIIGHGLDIFAGEDSTGSVSAGKSISAMGFVALMMGKYILVAALLFLVWRTGYLDVRPFLAGFLIAQIAVTWMSVAQSKKPLIGPQ